MRAETASVVHERVQPVGGEESFGRKDRVERGRSMSLAEDESVAVFLNGIRRVDSQDPVVEHPERVERRRSALRVFLVARGAGHEFAHALERVADRIHGG